RGVSGNVTVIRDIQPIAQVAQTSNKPVIEVPKIEKAPLNVVDNKVNSKPIKAKHNVKTSGIDPEPIPNSFNKVAAMAPVSQSWTLDGTKSLKDNVIEWGKKAGFTVVWNGEDYHTD